MAMHFKAIATAAFLSGSAISGMAKAETVLDCGAVFQKFKAENAIDLNQCTAAPADYTPTECPKPDGFVGAAPVTHIVLALDASGSMAGRSGSKSKMEIAKSEALSFLGDLHSTAKVSLVVYGHTGDNTEAGKATSCSGTETIHAFRASKSALKNSIGALGPVGWTPLAGALTHVQDEMSQLNADKAVVPVVYLISDGEETCGGDPVAAAKALAESGIRTTINTIGFDADETTKAQLEAIAEVGGGTYYPAEDAKALRAQLNAIRTARGAIYRYNNCVYANASRISGSHQRVTRELMRCYGQNDPHKFVSKALRAGKKAEPGSDLAQCAREVFDMARSDMVPYRDWINENVTPSIKAAVAESEAYVAEMGLIAPPE